MTAAANKTASRRRQRGLTLPGLIGAAIIVAILVYILLPTVPTFIEYRAVVHAVKKASAEGGSTPEGIRRAFDRYAAIDDITSIRGADLVIERSPNGAVVNFAYQRRIPLFGPASLVLDYAGSSASR